MAKSQRLLQLIQEVEVRPGQSCRQLAERFGCSERTIMRDFRHLEERLGLVITHDDGYRFFSKPFLPPLALTRDEVVAVILAQSLAQKHLDPITTDSLARAVDKMRRGLAGMEKQAADKVGHHTAVRPIAATEADTAATLLHELSQATQESCVVRFSYQGRSDQAPESRQVEPLGLSFQEGRWYLHAFDLARNGSRTFRLGRMSRLEVTRERFTPREGFCPEKAAFHQWDLGEGEPVELTLSVSAGLARWFAENRPHPSVQVNGTAVTLSVNDPPAFLRWMASLDDAELVGPPEARAFLRERLERVAKLYSGPEVSQLGTRG